MIQYTTLHHMLSLEGCNIRNMFRLENCTVIYTQGSSVLAFRHLCGWECSTNRTMNISYCKEIIGRTKGDELMVYS